MKYKHWLLFGLIILKFILQYNLIDPIYELHRDEFLHLDQARHLAWGYQSVPPVTSVISYIILLLGNGIFWVKFFPALFGALTILIVWRTIEALEGGWFALLLGSISILLSVLLRINTLYQPNSLDILSWTLLYYLLIRFIQSDRPNWLYMAAIIMAIGFLNKYNIAFLILGLLPALLLTEHRKVFVNKHLYGAAALALLLILPNLVWQYQNNFPVIHHLNELAATQLVNVNRSDFLKEQIMFFLGAIFVILAAFIGFIIYPPFKKYRVVGWSYLFTIVLFVFFRAKGYYAIGLYPVLLAFGAVYIEKLSYGRRSGYLRPVALIIPILLFFPMWQIAFPNRTPQQIRQKAGMYEAYGMLRWEDGKNHALPQDFADMLGWKELARKVDSAYAMVPEPENTMILCDNYGQAGAINYYSSHPNIGAVSMNADYINWMKLDKPIQYFIRVKEAGDNGQEMEKTAPFFESAVKIGEITNPYAREKGTTIYLFRNVKIDANERLRKEREDRMKW
ncbi:MAG: glycosyltransferase family 39 protein [Methylococcaceae bacterium]